MAAFRSSSIRINFTTGSSELDVLGVSRKLVKYVIHTFKRKNWRKKKKENFTQVAQTAIDQFLVSRNFKG
jgi:hypothetical protein